MKKYQIISLLVLGSCLFSSCLQNNPKNNGANTASENRTGEYAKNQNSSGKMEQENPNDNVEPPRLKYFYNIDSRNGMVTERIPFPKDWQQHAGDKLAFTGPNGIKVYGEGGKFFAYSNDPTILQQYQMTGMNVKYPLTMDQTIEEFLMPVADKVNRKMVKKYPIPQLMEFYKTFDGMLFKIEQHPKQFDATAIEWVDPDGTRWITVFNHQIEQGANQTFWGFQTGAMGAPPEIFEQAKQDYLNGLLNRQLNPEWINTMNKQTEYAIRKSNEAHQKREAEFKRGMAERQKQWEADQEVKANNQKQWEAGLEARSRRQEHIADVILGKTNIIDPETGTRHKIDHTSNRYWVNTKNEYVGTNTTYDDPNENAFINNETWREFKVDDYRN